MGHFIKEKSVLFQSVMTARRRPFKGEPLFLLRRINAFLSIRRAK
jgi:hypothetical protein